MTIPVLDKPTLAAFRWWSGQFLVVEDGRRALVDDDALQLVGTWSIEEGDYVELVGPAKLMRSDEVGLAGDPGRGYRDAEPILVFDAAPGSYVRVERLA